MRKATLKKKIFVLNTNKRLWNRYNNYVNGANLSSADLRCANLSSADLRSADLSSADLSSADLRCANLSSANLSYADLSYADLSYADLRCANLSSANLSYADLSCANLSRANLCDVMYNATTSFFALQCPEEGSFIAYKKASCCVVKLLIPEDAKRSSATSRKCRASKAKVLEIKNIKTGENLNDVCSNWDKNFIYTIGEIIEVDNFDKDRWCECAPGIHFFITRQEAELY